MLASVVTGKMLPLYITNDYLGRLENNTVILYMNSIQS